MTSSVLHEAKQVFTPILAGFHFQLGSKFWNWNPGIFKPSYQWGVWYVYIQLHMATFARPC